VIMGKGGKDLNLLPPEMPELLRPTRAESKRLAATPYKDVLRLELE